MRHIRALAAIAVALAGDVERARGLHVHGEHQLPGQHGARQGPARFIREGFKNVHNLEGGIDAWSQKIDPKVPRY